MMESQKLVNEGHLRDALAALQQEVRTQPSDPKLRIFLFQLLCTLGMWERAASQLEMCAQLDASTLAMVNTYREALRCERVRDAVFAGRHTPVVMGEPQDWVMKLVVALKLEAEGDANGAARLRQEAFDKAPPSRGTALMAETVQGAKTEAADAAHSTRSTDAIDSATTNATGVDQPEGGTPFEWISDADSRLGPVLEVIVNGHYAWLPISSIARLRIEPPTDLRDLVWAPVQIQLRNGGELVALVPTRYAPFNPEGDENLLMARSTEWLSLGHEQYAGRGHRVLTTQAHERPLLDWRDLRFQEADTPAGTP